MTPRYGAGRLLTNSNIKIMKTKTLARFALLVSCIVPLAPAAQARTKVAGQTVKVSLQRRIPSGLDGDAFIIVNEIQEWNGQRNGHYHM